MKFTKNIIKTFAIAGLLFAAVGCGSDFLNINTDPNNAARPIPKLLLPVVQVSLFSTVGDGVNGLGNPASSYAHYVNQRSAQIDNYSIAGSQVSIVNSWRNAYANVVENCNQIIAVSEPQKHFAYVGVAKIHKAVMFAYMVDLFGDIPFSEANQGSKFTAPKVDKGADIYAEVHKLLDEAIADLAKTSANSPSSDDLVFGGDLVRWRKFAKSFKLRLYNQVRRVQNVSSQVNALIAEGDLMTAANNNFSFQYRSIAAPDNRHPMFIGEYLAATRIYHISPYFFEVMADTSAVVANGISQISNPINRGVKDPRVPYYFYNQRLATQAAQNPVEYRLGGMISIYYNSNGPNRDFDQSNSLTVMGMYPCGGRYDAGAGGAVNLTSSSGAGVQRLLPLHSLLFTRAELAQAGVSNENARNLFAQAIDEAFAEVNRMAANFAAPPIPAASITAYRTAILAKYDAASNEGKLEHILTQKWIANFGNGVEAYNDVRRTGYPRTFVKTMPGVPAFVLNGSGVFPFSLPYSQNEINSNPNLVQKLVSTPAAKVFWQP